MTDRKEYMKAWKEAHKESEKAKHKAWKEAHKESEKAKKKAYYQTNKEKVKARREANIEHYRDYQRDYMKAYNRSDVNSLGQTKNSISNKSRRILKKMHLNIPGYEIHHCFTYDDASKFIYISKSLHLKIHKYLRDNNIDADADHWLQIREIVNSTYEFVYIKC